MGAISNMSRCGNCHDNAIIESFWSSLKLECLKRKRYHTRQETTLALFQSPESL